MDDPIISFRLSQIINDLLGNSDFVTVSLETAELIKLHQTKRQFCYVQMPSDCDVDLKGNLITEPRIWNIQSWQVTSEKWLRAKSYSDRERDKRFIYAANVKLISRKLMSFMEGTITPEMAHTLARKTLDKNNNAKLKALGVTKLITKVEEIN